MLESTQKQPYESYFVAGDFTEVLETGVTLDPAESSVTAADKDGEDATDAVLDTPTLTVEGPKLLIRCFGGEVAKAPYKLTFRTLTSSGDKWEIDGLLKVKEL